MFNRNCCVCVHLIWVIPQMKNHGKSCLHHKILLPSMNERVLARTKINQHSTPNKYHLRTPPPLVQPHSLQLSSFAISHLFENVENIWMQFTFNFTFNCFVVMCSVHTWFLFYNGNGSKPSSLVNHRQSFIYSNQIKLGICLASVRFAFESLSWFPMHRLYTERLTFINISCSSNFPASINDFSRFIGPINWFRYCFLFYHFCSILLLTQLTSINIFLLCTCNLFYCFDIFLNV